MSDTKRQLLEKLCDWMEEQPEYNGERLILISSDDSFSGLLLHNYGDQMQEARALNDVMNVFRAIFGEPCPNCGEFHDAVEHDPPIGGIEI
jgi:hypothetical protein